MTAATERPASNRALFWAFTALALQGFGGVLAVVQRELVERRRWLTQAEFVEDWAVAQVLPGPNVVNLALMLGDRWFGWRGAAAALAGMLLFPLLVVLALAVLYAQFAAQPQVAGAVRGMGVVAAGLFAGTGLKLAVALRTHPLGRWVGLAIAALTVACIAWLRLPLVAVLAVVGGAACVATWRRLPA